MMIILNLGAFQPQQFCDSEIHCAGEVKFLGDLSQVVSSYVFKERGKDVSYAFSAKLK